MPDSRIPDPTLMSRLQLSVKGVDWAASLVATGSTSDRAANGPHTSKSIICLATRRSSRSASAGC